MTAVKNAVNNKPKYSIFDNFVWIAKNVVYTGVLEDAEHKFDVKKQFERLTAANNAVNNEPDHSFFDIFG